LVKRLVAQELTLSFVPDAEQRLWRTLTRRKYQLTCDKVRWQNQLEALLEEAHIKLSSLVSDLLGASARRMLKALADGETNPAALAALADQRLRATPAQLCDALGACTELDPVYRRLVKMMLEELHLIEQQIDKLDQEIATRLLEWRYQPTPFESPAASAKVPLVRALWLLQKKPDGGFEVPLPDHALVLEA
jgi:transposase